MSRTTSAVEWVLEAPGELRQRTVQMDAHIRDGWVRIAPKLVGICGSDLHVFQGHRDVMPQLRLGHEVVAVVVDGNGTMWPPGTHVVLEPNVPCGACDVCHQGHQAACPHKTIFGITHPGGLSTLMDVPAEYLYMIPNGLPDGRAVFVEPLAVAMHAFRTMGTVLPGTSIAIVGGGAQGMLLAALFRNQNHVVLFENHPSRAQTVRTIDPSLEVRETSSEQFRYVFETGGTPGSAQLALDLLMPGGALVIVGLSQAPLNVTPFQIARNALTIRGSIIYDHGVDFPTSLTWLSRFAPPPLMPFRKFGFGDVPNAFLSLLSGEVLKAIIDIQEDTP